MSILNWLRGRPKQTARLHPYFGFNLDEVIDACAAHRANSPHRAEPIFPPRALAAAVKADPQYEALKQLIAARNQRVTQDYVVSEVQAIFRRTEEAMDGSPAPGEHGITVA